ncbi:hypothetical protein AVEN_130009-1 [Araneus ventricosus]|uniref:Uncharacterized protein n=1 Tax=Araneus ventricosus TaxID=182803 RepID=A0A4Y2T276_ARAVE|nr:hypothetical protein AVEN_130009-1 [Araneus ventricosus]
MGGGRTLSRDVAPSRKQRGAQVKRKELKHPAPFVKPVLNFQAPLQNVPALLPLLTPSLLVGQKAFSLQKEVPLSLSAASCRYYEVNRNRPHNGQLVCACVRG